jgi:hypothetical protein
MKAALVKGLVGSLALIAATAALACGHCVEDRIAAVYDHAMISQAAASKLRVAYFSWDGPVPRNEMVRAKIAAAVQGAQGVQMGGVRVSMEPAAIAVVFDPVRFTREQVDASLRKRLAPMKISHLLLIPAPPAAPPPSR